MRTGQSAAAAVGQRSSTPERRNVFTRALHIAPTRSETRSLQGFNTKTEFRVGSMIGNEGNAEVQSHRHRGRVYGIRKRCPWSGLSTLLELENWGGALVWCAESLSKCPFGLFL